MEENCIEQAVLNDIFPEDRTNSFFNALYGDAEDGAYDIVLVCTRIEEKKAVMAFELRRRANQCLKCSLTYGLPKVFEKHPIININGVAKSIASKLGWDDGYKWNLFPVEEISDDLHIIPFEIYKNN